MQGQPSRARGASDPRLPLAAPVASRLKQPARPRSFSNFSQRRTVDSCHDPCSYRPQTMAWYVRCSGLDGVLAVARPLLRSATFSGRSSRPRCLNHRGGRAIQHLLQETCRQPGRLNQGPASSCFVAAPVVCDPITDLTISLSDNSVPSVAIRTVAVRGDQQSVGVRVGMPTVGVPPAL
jgi:hypothetical protein